MNKLITNKITLILLFVIICPFTVKAQDSLKKVIVVVRPGGIKPATPSTTSPAITPSQTSASPALLASNSVHLATSPASHLTASPTAQNDAKPTTVAQKNNSAAPSMVPNTLNGITTTTTKTVTTVTTTTITVVTTPAKAVVQYIAPGSRPTGYIAPSTAERTDPSFYMHRAVVPVTKNTIPVTASVTSATKNTAVIASVTPATKSTTPIVTDNTPVSTAPENESLTPVGPIATPVDAGVTSFRSTPGFLANAVGINTVKIAIDTPVKLVVRPGITDSTAKKDTLLATKLKTDTVDSLPGKHRSNKILFAELGGAGVAISINYDSRFKGGQKDGFGYRVGIGYFAAGNNTVFTIPLQVNYLLGKDGKYLELGLGTTFINSRGDNYSSPTWEFDTVTGLSGTATIGFRYEPNHALNFRIGYVPIVSCYGLINAGGFSIGYTF